MDLATAVSQLKDSFTLGFSPNRAAGGIERRRISERRKRV
jgi:hypothetical protein